MVDGLRPCIPGGTGYPCPGGEDHLKRRSSSPPVPPLLGCRHCSKESIFCHSGGKPWTSLCAGYLLGRLCKCRKRSNAGDARGEAPCIRKQKNTPLPAGKGGRGDGGKKQAKGRASQCRWGQAPLQAPQRQGYPAPQGQALLPPAPLRVPDWQSQPATEKKTPPPETTGGGVREKTIS